MADRSILLLLGSSTGGIGTHVAALVEDLLAGGWQVTVHAPASTVEVFRFPGARVVRGPVGPGALLRPRGLLALRRLASAHAVTHAHGLQAGVTAALAGSGSRLVVTWHNAPLSTGGRRRLHELLERVVARRAAVTVGASPDLVVRAEQAGSRDARFVPVAPPRLVPTARASALRSELAPSTAPIVLAVGRLHEQKRFDVLVEAAASWQYRDPSPVVVIAGDGPCAVALQQQAERLAVRLRLLGRRDDVADLLAVADVVVLPSEWEARPLAAQEALAAGRALVATPVGGVPELVGDAAVLVPVGDARALGSAVEALLDDDAARARLEKLASSQAATWPDTHQVAQTLMSLYLELAEHR